MPLGLGPWELLLILLIVLLLFGAKRVPDMGRSLGRGMREFKEGITDPFADTKNETTRQLEAGERAAPTPVETTREHASS